MDLLIRFIVLDIGEVYTCLIYCMPLYYFVLIARSKRSNAFICTKSALIFRGLWRVLLWRTGRCRRLLRFFLSFHLQETHRRFEGRPLRVEEVKSVSVVLSQRLFLFGLWAVLFGWVGRCRRPLRVEEVKSTSLFDLWTGGDVTRTCLCVG